MHFATIIMCMYLVQLYIANKETVQNALTAGYKIGDSRHLNVNPIILDLLRKEKLNEAYFRHLKKKYFQNFKTKEYMVSIHKEIQRCISMLQKF